MIERNGDLFAPRELNDARAVLIPTNGQVNSRGEAVMGAGVALEAARRWPWMKRYLGEQLQRYGNRPHYLGCRESGDYASDARHYPWSLERAQHAFCACAVLSFPTKNHWNVDASLDLIKQSAELTRIWVDNNCEPDCVVLLPRVGAGLGSLDWVLVRAVLVASFDDRFHVLTKEGA